MRSATIVFSPSDSFSMPNIALLTEKPRSGIALLCESVKAAFATWVKHLYVFRSVGAVKPATTKYC